MALRYCLLMCIAIDYAIAHPFPQPEPDEAEPSDSSLGVLLQNFKSFNGTNLLASFRLPACVQQCVDDMASTADSLDSDDRRSFERTKVACGQLESMKRCLAAKPTCNSMVVEIGMHTLEYLCTEDEAALGLVPCIRREAVKIHATCERACKLGATLMDAASLNAKRTDSLNFLDENGNKVLSLPDLQILCNSSTCFLSCMRTGVDEKCPRGGSKLIDNILSSLMKRTAVEQQYLPETKVLDSYAAVVSSVLPRQCQNLALKDKDIILTTPLPASTFVTDSDDMVVVKPLVETAPVDGLASHDSYPAVETRNEVVLKKNGASEGNGKDEKENASSVNGAIFPVVIAMILLTAYVGF